MTTVWSGLAVGAVYVLTAAGYNIVFVGSRIFNFAHAQFVMLSTFVAYWLGPQLGLPFWACVVLGAALGAVAGGMVERVAISPVAGLGAHAELVTTVGVAVLLDGAAQLIWGSDPREIPFVGSSQPLTLVGGQVLPAEVTMIVAAVGVTIALAAWARFTRSGLLCRAAAEDSAAAALRGINVRLLRVGSFAAAGALAGATGGIIGPQTYAVFNLGDTLVIMAFVGLAIGGFGSFGGALVGGLSIGLVQAVSNRYLNSSLGDLFVFCVLIGVLFMRPTGLFGHRAERIV